MTRRTDPIFEVFDAEDAFRTTPSEEEMRWADPIRAALGKSRFQSVTCVLRPYIKGLVGREGIEPSTNGLRVRCSTS